MRRALFIVVTLLAAMIVIPTSVASASALNSLTITPGVVNNGQSATGDLTMAFADPNPTTVLLFSSDPAAAQVPVSIVGAAPRHGGVLHDHHERFRTLTAMWVGKTDQRQWRRIRARSWSRVTSVGRQ